MIKNIQKILGTVAICASFVLFPSIEGYADVNAGPGLSAGGFVVTVTADVVNINKEHGSDEVLVHAKKDSVYEIIQDMGDGWAQVKVGNTSGYLPVSEAGVISPIGEVSELVTFEVQTAEVAAAKAAEASKKRREDLVNYGLQFVGGRYRYGGTDPNTGADCSGFTGYVMRHGAGVSLNRSSTGQSKQGVQVSAEQMRPGDLIFYGTPKNIDHVAMYIGNGQIVHSSTPKTGIKVSQWNYRAPLKIMNVLGD